MKLRLIAYVVLGIVVLLAARPLMVRYMLSQENEKSKRVELATDEVSTPSIGGASAGSSGRSNEPDDASEEASDEPSDEASVETPQEGTAQ